MSARKFLDAAQQTGDHMLFYTVFRSFQQRNHRLRGSPSFNPGETPKYPTSAHTLNTQDHHHVKSTEGGETNTGRITLAV